MQYNTTLQYNTVQYNTRQYKTIQYNATQYNTITYLQLLQEDGAGHWLSALPTESARNMVSPDLYDIMLRRCLSVLASSDASFCPFCDIPVTYMAITVSLAAEEVA